MTSRIHPSTVNGSVLATLPNQEGNLKRVVRSGSLFPLFPSTSLSSSSLSFFASLSSPPTAHLLPPLLLFLPSAPPLSSLYPSSPSALPHSLPVPSSSYSRLFFSRSLVLLLSILFPVSLSLYLLSLCLYPVPSSCLFPWSLHVVSSTLFPPFLPTVSRVSSPCVLSLCFPLCGLCCEAGIIL